MFSLATLMALLRGLHLAATLSLLGTVGFIAWMLPAASAAPDRLKRRLGRLWWTSGLLALVAGVAWFVLQSAAIASATTMSEALASLPLVAGHTRFGTVLMLRLGLLAAATLVPLVLRGAGRIPLYFTLLATAVALGLQGMIGHAGATGGAIGDGLVLSESLHLLAAGIWLGALIPLGFSLRALGSADAVAVCERFSPIGLACVLVIAGTGFAQAMELIGSIPALFGTTYGHIALVKISLFILTLVLAAMNRLWLTDRLADGARDARQHLTLSIAVETCAGLCIVCAASFMASSVPAAHSTVVWPFPWQFSLDTVNQDPIFRQEVVFSLIAIGIAIALTVAALTLRRYRLLALAFLELIVVWRIPSLTLLTTDAYPTSFQTSPTEFGVASIAHGQMLFAKNCVACHGVQGRGDGPVAASLRIKPADLTQPHIWGHTDGEMFWWLTHGVEDPEGGLAMPGFGGILSPDDRWALIDYVRAHNAGLAMQQDAAFDIPVRAPAMPIACSGIAASSIDDLHGHAVHVIAGEPAKDQPPVPPQAGVSTITVVLPPDTGGTIRPTPGACVAEASSAWDAYAVLADLPADRLAGSEFLVDQNGWLRAVHQAGAPGGWHTRDDLIAAIRGICSHPIRQAVGGAHEHHH